MKLTKNSAEILVPDGIDNETALCRTTHMGIGAHQDDLETMALHGILECFDDPDRWFCGITCTNGEGSPRTGAYTDYTNKQMQTIRHAEQRQAACIGRFGSLLQLDYAATEIKETLSEPLVSDLKNILDLAAPEVIYTHNIADKHETHLAVAAAVIEAVRALPPEKRPTQFVGCEGWRNLDWLPDHAKVLLDVSKREHLARALIGVYDSQISGGQRVDLASEGRMLANATFLDSHSVDQAVKFIYALDLMPLVRDDSISPVEYIDHFISELRSNVVSRLENYF